MGPKMQCTGKLRKGRTEKGIGASQEVYCRRASLKSARTKRGKGSIRRGEMVFKIVLLTLLFMED